jgi:hypothetical protein
MQGTNVLSCPLADCSEAVVRLQHRYLTSE